MVTQQAQGAWCGPCVGQALVWAVVQRLLPQTCKGLVCRHPLDQQNTALLQVLPGLEVLAKSLMGEALHICTLSG